MKVLMTGGTGFVGTQFASRLFKEGFEVTVQTRPQKGTESRTPSVSYLQSDPTQKGNWRSAINDHDVIINLAGASGKTVSRSSKLCTVRMTLTKEWQ